MAISGSDRLVLPPALALVLLLVLALVPAAPAGAAAPQVARLALPGEVVASAELAGGGVALAAATPDGEVALWRVAMGPDGPALWPIQAGLGALLGITGADAPRAADVVRLAPAAGAGGGGELLVSAPGAIWRVGSGAPARVPVERGFAMVPLAEDGSRLARSAPEGPLAVARAGELRLLDPATGGELARVRLPAEARPQSWGLELRSPPVRRLPRPLGGTLVVVGPQAVGERRLRTLLVDAAGAVSEAWSLLPSGGRLLGSRLLDVDGRLVMAALTASEGLFAKQRLHLFAPAPDRTRRGVGPLLSVEMDVRHWFEPDVLARDLDGDGRAELLLVEPRGLGGRELTVARFTPSGGGRFATPPRRVKVGDDSRRWSYGGDVDGDGLADLLQFVSGKLALHRGQGGGRGGAVSAQPEWSLELAGGTETRTIEVGVGAGGGGAAGETRARDGGTRPEDAGDDDGDEAAEEESFGPSRLAVADLDRDGRGEVLVWRTREEGGSELTVLWQPRR